MKARRIVTVFFILVIMLALITSTAAAKKRPPAAAGNNLSFPVLWAEGVTKTLPGTAGMTPITNGVWWWWWGTEGVDPNIVPLACAPDPQDLTKCDDGNPLTASSTLPPADDPDLVKAYLQKDLNNTWQAGSADVSSSPVIVDWIDWGDDLESQNWYLTSKVRTEVVLFKDLTTPMLEYGMRHTSGWGIDEVHGLAVKDGVVEIGPGTQATVYSYCARLTIQKLLLAREDARLVNLVWVPAVGWTESEAWKVDPNYTDLIIDSPLFNKPVWEGGDGPGYYAAEINVKGRIIYGYTWDVKRSNDGAGDYRLTFSLDSTCGTKTRNTSFVSGTTQILLPVEEVVIEAEPTTGGEAFIDFANNLTYMDIRITNRR